jgi:hypothetical protein
MTIAVLKNVVFFQLAGLIVYVFILSFVRHDKTPGLSFDTAMYPLEYKNLHGNSR